MNFRDAYIHMLLQESETDDWEFDFRRMGADPKRARKMAELIDKVGKEPLTDEELDKAETYHGLLRKYYEKQMAANEKQIAEIEKEERELEQRLKELEKEVEYRQGEVDYLKSGGPISPDEEEDDPADWWKKQ